MATKNKEIHVGSSRLAHNSAAVTGGYTQLRGETYYRIQNVDQLPPFFMSIVSSDDHWLFVSSRGGLSAGRINSDSALFPYETEDKLAANSDNVGGKTIILATRAEETYLWEPFSQRYAGLYRCQRHLYKNVLGNKLVFEEVNHDLGLTFRASWRTGPRFGFIRTGWLLNQGGADVAINLVDGLQNLLPYGATQSRQTSFSNLLNAYKRNELDPSTGLGIFALSATLTDQAEPSESLQATVAWQVGLPAPTYLLSTIQLAAFRRGAPLTPEHDIRARPGAYLVQSQLFLAPDATATWHVVADVNQDSAAVVSLRQRLRQANAETLQAQLEGDVESGSTQLATLLASADGYQQTADHALSGHHLANVLFNIMRGGVFNHGYLIEKRDFLDFVDTRNRPVATRHAEWLAALPATFTNVDLYQRAAQTGDADLQRLSYEYLPLTFSRRHGDPSRPWNHFSINLKNPDGSRRLDYQGNWRDIFQNWEALTLSFPAFLPAIIAKFLNATTADGFNPYRVTRDGIEWEVPEPDNPWSNIGYWSDHQIIYLQKLLEWTEKSAPGTLTQLWRRPIFAHANVPYRLRPYQEMIGDWYNTITFDWESERAIEDAVAVMGTDARLRLTPPDAGAVPAPGAVKHVTMIEKLLILLLAKLTNLVPEGGIWMNTQRPEWNDANNALVGKGLSVVTTAYLRRFITFWLRLSSTQTADDDFTVSDGVATLLAAVTDILTAHATHLETGFDAATRRQFMDEMGAAATQYRDLVYSSANTATTTVNGQQVTDLLRHAQTYVDHTLRANRRPDHLYHAYNTLRLQPDAAYVDHLYLMLEGQVAILSTGLLTAAEVVDLLGALRQSDLYRADQHSYMLYPDRALAGFLTKNHVPAARLAGSALTAALDDAGDGRLLVRDAAGDYHFNGHFRNAADVRATLDDLARDPALADLATTERVEMLDLFEEIFNHAQFTGRSGTFFAYEGLGSIYWHMVAKLLLAVQEQILTLAPEDEQRAALIVAYYDVRQGLGFNKSPAVYGAFPTDPYSHTPGGGGARQPGMTGQVKEEILTRLGELGVVIDEGAITFAPSFLRREEFLSQPADFTFVDKSGQQVTLPLPAGALAFTLCQTPVTYQRGAKPQIVISGGDGQHRTIAGTTLDPAQAHHIFNRTGHIRSLRVTLAD